MPNERLLILSVDRDDDIGFKADIISPVIGREACIQAANRLALVDPEDSDINALFQAIRIYDDLKGRGEDPEIAILSGSHADMMEGDRKIAVDLDMVVKRTGATSAIVVTDGMEDEYVVPIIISRIPVATVKRVVVTQIPNLESTYYIIKRLFEDPKIARVTLVPLGLAMLLFAIASMLGYPEGATIIVFGVVGLYLLFKGFGLDEVISFFVDGMKVSLRKGRLSFVTYIAAALFGAIGIIMGFINLLRYYPSDETFGLFILVVSFIYGSVGWLTGAGLMISLGKLIDSYLNEPPTWRRVVVLPFFVSAVGSITYGASLYTLSISGVNDFPIAPEYGLLYLVILTIGGLFCALIGVYARSHLGVAEQG
ncbi:MAG: DUF373 family protein [Methanomicrobiales archaeon]|nr:DUF373 family protein [Methanomicrobiales archaeon]